VDVIIPLIVFIVFCSPIAFIFCGIKILVLKKILRDADQQSQESIRKNLRQFKIGLLISAIILGMAIFQLAIMSVQHSG
jgi:hypothetical protein